MTVGTTGKAAPQIGVTGDAVMATAEVDPIILSFESEMVSKIAQIPDVGQRAVLMQELAGMMAAVHNAPRGSISVGAQLQSIRATIEQRVSSETNVTSNDRTMQLAEIHEATAEYERAARRAMRVSGHRHPPGGELITAEILQKDEFGLWHDSHGHYFDYNGNMLSTKEVLAQMERVQSQAAAGTTHAGTAEQIHDAHADLDEAEAGGDTVRIRRSARRVAEAEGGTEAERLARTRSAATTATARRLAGDTLDAASRGDVGRVVDNVGTAGSAVVRNVVTDPMYGAIARGHYDHYVQNPQNRAKLRAMGINSFEQFEAYRQEVFDMSYQQMAALKSNHDGTLWMNTLSYEEFTAGVDAMSRFGGINASDMAAINRQYRNNRTINSNGGEVTLNDIRRAMNRAGITTAEADSDHDGRIERNEMDAVLRRIAGGADRNGDGRVSAGEQAFASKSTAEQNQFLTAVRARAREVVAAGLQVNSAYDANHDGRVTVEEAANALINRGITNVSQIDSAAEFQALMCVRPNTQTRGAH